MEIQDVGCAVIIKKDTLLIAQRKPGSFLGGYWEFPGGKCENGETIERCLVREVFEELGIHIQPRQLLRQSNHTYPEKKVALHFYLCDWVSGHPVRHDCLDFRWAEPEELRRFRFPLGDDDIINELIRHKARYFRR